MHQLNSNLCPEIGCVNEPSYKCHIFHFKWLLYFFTKPPKLCTDHNKVSNTCSPLYTVQSARTKTNGTVQSNKSSMNQCTTDIYLSCWTTKPKGSFTLARFRRRFRTKLARLVMKTKKICNKTCQLNAKLHAKFANVNAP